MANMASVVVVVGNPKLGSRTRTVAEKVADRAGDAAGFARSDRAVIELAEFGPQLFDWNSEAVRAQVDLLRAARLAVVASPIFKATYTGLLKAFLDWFSQTGLAGVSVVPVMIGAGAQHALAVEVHLRPLLVEIGATVATRGVFVQEEQLEQLDATLDAWSHLAEAPIAALARGE